MASLLAMTLCCGGVKTESSPEDPDPELLSIELLDGVDADTEGNDDVSVKVTQGEAAKMLLFVSTDGGANYENYPMSANEASFKTDPYLGGYKTHWYITAENESGSAMANLGSARDPFFSHKTLSKNNADIIINSRMKEIRSAQSILRYDNLIDGDSPSQYTFTFTDEFGFDYTTDVDHHVLAPMNDEARHRDYIIEYSQGTSGKATEENGTYQALLQAPRADIGMVIIYSTDRSSLEELLRDESVLSKESGGLDLFEY
ncbi:MAG: hypothetical protein HQL32_07025 [Planctomycetes bacterium]|nr:hypothetical protein [Planctomycetota bacterium]